MEGKGKVAIVGSGLIGRCWAVLFAKAGYHVNLYDVEPSQVQSALEGARKQLVELETQGLLTNTMKTADSAFQLIHGISDLEEAMRGAIYLQECVPENVDLKKKVFQQLDKHASSEIILASSSSCICPSLFTQDLVHAGQCIVAHPINPPTFVKLVEVIPSPLTKPNITDRTVALMKDIGQSPVVVRKEVNGFILNRLQYAVLMEAWRLVEDGVCSPEDIDTTMREGLAPRYTLIGPFETMHLNANGVKDYCTRYGANIENVCKEQLNTRPFTGSTMEKVHEAMCNRVPVESLPERREWRDKRLAALAIHSKQQEENETKPDL